LTEQLDQQIENDAKWCRDEGYL